MLRKGQSTRTSPRPIVVWLAAIASAATLDMTVAKAMREREFDAYLQAHHLLRETLKAPGVYMFTIALAVLIFLFHPLRWRATALLLVGTGLSGVNYIIKWAVGRSRPFRSLSDGSTEILRPFELHPFPGGIEGMWRVPNLCFPSGHVALAFATAAVLGILVPRWRWGWYGIAAAVAAERVAENSHWLSDTVAAAALGVAAAWCARRIIWDRHTISPRDPPHG